MYMNPAEESQTSVSSEASPQQPAKKNGYGLLTLLLVAFIALVMGAAGGYFFGMQGGVDGLGMKPEPTPTPTEVLAEDEMPEPTTALLPNLPANWRYQQSDACRVSVPLPPKEEPFYIPDNPDTPPAVNDEGGWWQYEAHGSDNPNDAFFDNQAIAVFKNPDAPGSGYVPGLVQVMCGPNTQRYTTQEYIAAYGKQFTDGTFSGLEFVPGSEVSMWDRQVTPVTITGGMYSGELEYFFATPTTLYRVRTVTMSTNTIIQDTTRQIFEGLLFYN